jgi:hypothetical protein
MARIDPKNDELGLMENIFRGVRSTGYSENQTSEPAADVGCAEPTAAISQGTSETVGTSGVKPATSDATPLSTDPTPATHPSESQS